ncbi:hypothetical protein BAZ10_05175 [Elizabethkingia occulta]|uniref:Uncharacterized protein n=1 Tax=Elizabethkingia occulta TaxID=1867263 RepID=A0A1T3MGB9_9FLAO|nr:hypothetical protein BB020_02230 [Elizabethkingia occulta]OPC63479.1 hypothetical protein BAZ10_05175 [Elizabethkingia occulta]
MLDWILVNQIQLLNEKKLSFRNFFKNRFIIFKIKFQTYNNPPPAPLSKLFIKNYTVILLMWVFSTNFEKRDSVEIILLLRNQKNCRKKSNLKK